MRSLSLYAIATVLCMASASNAWSSPELRWLNNSPVRHFTDADWQMAKAAMRDALESSADGDTVSWENPETGTHGSVTPQTTETRNGMTCRQAKISNHARHLDGGGTFLFCRRADGSWGIDHEIQGQ